MDTVHEQQHKTEDIDDHNDDWVLLYHGISDHLNGVAHHQAYECCHTVRQWREEAYFSEQACAQ